MRMKKLFILFVLLNYLLCLFSQNKFAGVNLSLTSKVCTQSFSENQITYLNIGLSSSTHLLCGLGANLFTLRADTIKGISIAGIGHLNHYEGLLQRSLYCRYDKYGHRGNEWYTDFWYS